MFAQKTTMCNKNNLQNRRYVDLNTNNSNDKLKYTIEGDLIHWYENNFITYGFQKIKNDGDSKEVKKKRKVYDINKLSF